MPADVQQVKGDQVIADPDDVEGVSGQLVAGPVRPGKVQPLDFRKAFGQERPLYTGGGIQVSLHTLIRTEEILILPLDLREGFLQLVRHAVECLGEVSHEIDALA